MPEYSGLRQSWNVRDGALEEIDGMAWGRVFRKCLVQTSDASKVGEDRVTDGGPSNDARVASSTTDTHGPERLLREAVISFARTESLHGSERTAALVDALDLLDQITVQFPQSTEAARIRTGRLGRIDIAGIRGELGISEEEGEPFEPQRGTPLREAILDAARAEAERLFGSPVEFVVNTLKTIDDLAYADLWAQRPGGEPIDLRATPAHRRGEIDLDPAAAGDPENLTVLLRRVEGIWRIALGGVAITEAFWLEECAFWGRLMPETCGGTTTASVTGSDETSRIPSSAASGAETVFHEAVTRAFGQNAAITPGEMHMGEGVAFFSAEVAPLKPDGTAPRAFGQVLPTFPPGNLPIKAPDMHVFEVILQEDRGSWRVAQARVDPVQEWWRPFCAGLEGHLGAACSPTDRDSAAVFQWPEPVRTLNISASASGDAELDAFIASTLPPWLVPTKVEYRIFPRDDGGRISVAGTLQLAEPTVELAPGLPTLRAAARARGLVNDAFLYQALADLYGRPRPDQTNRNHLQEYRVVAPAGTEIPFGAELSYIETVREKKISGSLNYSLGAGEPMSQIPAHSYVPGDSRFFEVASAALTAALELQSRAIETIVSFSSQAPEGLVFAMPSGDRVFELTFDPDIPPIERLRETKWSGEGLLGWSHSGKFIATWTGRVDVHRQMNYSPPLGLGDSLRAAVPFYFSGGPDLDGSSIALFLIGERGAMGVADGLQWDSKSAQRGLFVERRLTSVGMVAWPK